jgi:hypothetical protein
MSPASVQVRLDLDSVAHDVARFGSGAHAHRLAVLDVTGADQSLASADDAQQEELLAGRAQFLNAQLGEFQVLVRAEPVDLSDHLERIHQQALGLPEALARLAYDYVAFVRTLAHQRLLVSTYRLLAALVAEQASAEPVQVLAWEYRWRRTCQSADVVVGTRQQAVELPGAADLVACSGWPGYSVLLLPDLGTAPVARYRGLVRRLLGLRAAAGDPRLPEPLLVIATPDPDGHGGRSVAWRCGCLPPWPPSSKSRHHEIACSRGTRLRP